MRTLSLMYDLLAGKRDVLGMLFTLKFLVDVYLIVDFVVGFW